MASELPSWLDVSLPEPEELKRRLQLIVPEAIDPRGWARREMAAKTLFTLLYGYAIEGEDRWMRPTAVTDMTDEQAVQVEPQHRRAWLDLVQSSRRPRQVHGRWYSENTREPIRDETLRLLLELGVVVERSGLPTTSPVPRYALARHFLPLCNPDLAADHLVALADSWREEHLRQSVLARLALARRGAISAEKEVLVAFPNGEVRRLAPGPSSRLTKAVVEVFAARFLTQAAVVLISESAVKISYRDDAMLDAIGLRIETSGSLPDVVLADVGADPPVLVFVECVVTDGAITESRRRELEQIATASGFRPSDCAYVTVFHDRVESPYRTTATSLAWGALVWFETEPENLILLLDGKQWPTLTLATFRRPDIA